MLLPLRTKIRPESIPGVTGLLIVANIVVFCATSNGLHIRPEVAAQFGEHSAYSPALQILARAFLHGSLLQLVVNVWFLYLFGFPVEGRLRSLLFSALYIGSIFLDFLAQHVMFGQVHHKMESVGASGAIAGTVGAAIFMFPLGKVQFAYTWASANVLEFGDGPIWAFAILYAA